MRRRHRTVYVVSGSHIYHRDRNCPRLALSEQDPEPRCMEVHRSGPRAGRWRYRPCHICAVEL